MGRRMKHTEIGDIPADWEIQTFEETFRVLSNNTLSRENLNNRGGAVRNIHYGDILTKFSEVLDCNEDDIPYLNDLSLITASTQLLQDGDVVIADTAEDETVGKTVEIQNLENGKLIAGLHTIPCRVKKGKFAPGWLGYYMNSHIYHDQIIPFVTGIKVSSISKSAIAETIILIPPIEEQERIIETLTQIEKMIKQEVVIVNKIKSFKSGCLTKMLPREDNKSPEMRFTEYNGAWEQRELGEMCDEFQSGKSIKASEITNSGCYAVYGGNGFRGYTNTYNHDGDFALIGRQGALCGNMNFSSGKAYFTEHAVAVHGNNDNDTLFLYYLLDLMNLGQYSGQSAQPGLAVNKIIQLTTKVPNIAEQKQISSYFKSLDHLITLHQRKCDKYISIKSGLISMLISLKQQTH